MIDMDAYLLGCDVGTTSTKTVLVETSGRVCAEHQVGYEVSFPNPGWAEQDANLYWNAVVQSCRVVIEKADINSNQIGAIGLSGMAPNCILVDSSLEPLKSGLIWMDNRAVKESAWLNKVIGEEAAFRTNANPIHPYYGIPKIMWERDNHPEIYKHAYKVLSAKDFIFARFTGKVCTDYSTATLAGIAFDIRNKKWEQSILDEIGISEDIFPEIAPCEKIMGIISADAAKITGLTEGTPVVAGTVDTGADAVACNTIRQGSSFLTMGTAICLGVVSDKPEFARGLMAFPHPVNSQGKYITTGVVTSGGALMKWLSNILLAEKLDHSESIFALLDHEAGLIPSGSSGLIALPYFMGERAPIWNADARGVLFGLSLNHQRGHIARALLESVGFALRTIIELAQKNGITYKDSITLIGGGAKSRIWNQILADITGFKMVEARHAAGAAVGSALIAGVGCGIIADYQSIQNWIGLGDPAIPNEKNKQKYDHLFQLFQSLYFSLLPNYQQLGELDIQSS